MSDIQRFGSTHDDLTEMPDGEWVTYEDHIKQIDDTHRFLVTERDNLIKKVDDCKQLIQSMQDIIAELEKKK